MNDKITIKSILGEMKQVVEEDRVVGVNWWLNQAVQLNALWPDLKNELIKAEMNYRADINDLMSKDDKISYAKAENIIKGIRPVEGQKSSYELYRYLFERDKVIAEMIKIAKKQASIETDFS